MRYLFWVNVSPDKNCFLGYIKDKNRFKALMPDRAALIEKLTGFWKGDVSMDYERVDGPTPSGGDYSEIYYCDDNNNRVDSKYATRFHIRECKADGSLVFETHGLIHK